MFLIALFALNKFGCKISFFLHLQTIRKTLTKKTITMNYCIYILLFALFSLNLQGQSSTELWAGNRHAIDFNSIASGLPAGWTVRENATDSTIGDLLIFDATPQTWSNPSGGFKNVASSDGLNVSSNSNAQNNSSNRALGIRQTNSFGDPGASFMWTIDNTLGRENLSIEIDHLILSPQDRSTRWLVQYSVDGGNTWTTIGQYETPLLASTADWGDSTATYPLGNNAANQSGNLIIRIATLDASIGSGSRDSYAIDNIQLQWTLNCSSPQLPLTFSHQNVTFDRADMAWSSSACADEFMLVATENPSITATPTGNGSAYTAGSFGSGTAIAPNEYVVYKGTHVETAVSGLLPASDYTIGLYVRRNNDWVGPITTTFTTPTAGSMFYTGLGTPGIWNDPNNWSLSRTPDVFDTVVLDNRYVNHHYVLTLPDHPVAVRAIYLYPSDSVTLVLPSSNTNAPGLDILAADTGLVIGNHATFVNQSGASSGTGWLANEWVIREGGSYMHDVNRATVDLLSSLSSTLPDFDKGQWIFGPNFSGVPSFTNRTYPSLSILGAPQPITFVSGSPLTISGNLHLGPSAMYDFTLPVILKGDALIEGDASFSHIANPALTLDGTSPQHLTILPHGSCSLTTESCLRVYNDVTLTGTLLGDSLITNTTASFTTSPSGALFFWTYIFDGDVINNGTITLPANDSNYAQMRHTNCSGSGLLEQQMHLNGSGAQWHTLGSPSAAPLNSMADSNAHFNTSTPQTSPVFFWDENNGQYELPASSSEVMTPGRGYVVFAGSTSHGTFTTETPGVLKTRGTLSSVEPVDITLKHSPLAPGQSITVHGEDDGWNLCANPYPMSYDWHNHNVPIHTEATIYVPNGTNNGFIAVGVTETDSSRYLPPMQGFWIRTDQMLNSGTATLVLQPGHRAFNRSNYLKRSQQNHPRFKFTVTNEMGHKDYVTVGFHPLATEQFDAKFDGHKRQNSPSLGSVWAMHNGRAHALLYLPSLHDTRAIPISFSTPGNDLYTFELENDYSNSTQGIWLEDTHLNIIRDLRHEQHSFRSSADSIENRYILHIGNRPSSTIEFYEKASRIWWNERQLYAHSLHKTNVCILSIHGSILREFDHTGHGVAQYDLSDLPAGVYLVKARSSTVKIILK